MTTIRLKRGTGVPSPSALQVGEVAVDITNGRAYTKTQDNAVREVSPDLSGYATDADLTNYLPTAELNNTLVATTVRTKTSGFNLTTADANTVIVLDGTCQSVGLPAYSSVALAVGTRVTFIQKGPNLVRFIPYGGAAVTSYGNYTQTNHRYARVEAVKIGIDEWFISGDLRTFVDCPLYGTTVSNTCVDGGATYQTDAEGTVWPGNYTEEVVVADGAGGTITTYNAGAGGCFLPNGFVVSYFDTVNDLSWTGCDTSGTYVGMQTVRTRTVADGSGATNVVTSELSTAQSPGFVLGTGPYCTVIYDGGLTYHLEYASPDPYGTKYGTPYWDSGTGTVVQDVADGSFGTVTIAWDGLAPWPVYGTQLSVPTAGTVDLYDALYSTYPSEASGGTGIGYFIMPTSDTLRSDGAGGSYTDSVPTGTLPYGWAFSVFRVNGSDYDTSYSVYDNGLNTIYPWLWGYVSADGAGGTLIRQDYGTLHPYAPSGTIVSPDFTEYYSGVTGRIYTNGYGDYFFAEYT